jgi:GNAT superfamily N-acetyltransferase
MEVVIREVRIDDLMPLLDLYTHLHEKQIPDMTDELKEVWQEIIHDPHYHIVVAEKNGVLVSSCTVVTIPNLTNHYRPYALVENVVTRAEERHRGYASRCLFYAKQIAQSEHCYKMMLLTGSKQEEILNFYRQAGYLQGEKTGFVQWL